MSHCAGVVAFTSTTHCGLTAAVVVGGARRGSNCSSSVQRACSASDGGVQQLRARSVAAGAADALGPERRCRNAFRESEVLLLLMLGVVVVVVVMVVVA